MKRKLLVVDSLMNGPVVRVKDSERLEVIGAAEDDCFALIDMEDNTTIIEGNGCMNVAIPGLSTRVKFCRTAGYRPLTAYIYHA